MLLLLGLAWRPDGSDGLDPDEALVRRFQSGDREAYSDIVRRYQDRIFTLSLRWMGDRQVAEEVAQDVFVALYRSLDRFRGEARLSTWIFRVTVNHCKNRRLYRRRRKMGQHEPLEGPRSLDDDGPVRQLPDKGPGTDTRVHRSEAARILQDALDQLDDSYRTILVLRDVEDLPYEEIAQILELPRGTVKSRLHRARAELARVLSRTIRPEDIFE
ncbi:MAG: sigma-70 family RNA polymerase sigma factor [Oligoflexia bacterium]|nr:sigma-70 family RNA polymerase sigma factor [Oligoflexia bacterium]